VVAPGAMVVVRMGGEAGSIVHIDGGEIAGH
jgi:hypothetical protein